MRGNQDYAKEENDVGREGLGDRERNREDKRVRVRGRWSVCERERERSDRGGSCGHVCVFPPPPSQETILRTGFE